MSWKINFRFACLLACLSLSLVAFAPHAFAVDEEEDEDGNVAVATPVKPARGDKSDKPKDGGPKNAGNVDPADAGEHVGETCTIEFTVKAGRKLQDKNVCFLNSTESARDSECFTAFIGGKGLRSFKDEKKIDDPAKHFVGKKIRVTGVVKMHKDKPEIVVERWNQIEDLNAEAEETADEE